MVYDVVLSVIRIGQALLTFLQSVWIPCPTKNSKNAQVHLAAHEQIEKTIETHSTLPHYGNMTKDKNKHWQHLKTLATSLTSGRVGQAQRQGLALPSQTYYPRSNKVNGWVMLQCMGCKVQSCYCTTLPVTCQCRKSSQQRVPQLQTKANKQNILNMIEHVSISKYRKGLLVLQVRLPDLAWKFALLMLLLLRTHPSLLQPLRSLRHFGRCKTRWVPLGKPPLQMTRRNLNLTQQCNYRSNGSNFL